jgi:hypothetical protein
MYSRTPITVFLVVLCLVTLPLSALAETWNLLPRLSISGIYDDNITFSPNDEVDDYFTSIHPSIALGYRSEVSRFDGLADVNIKNYAQEKDLNTVNFLGRLNGNTRISERFSINGNLRYIKDTLLDSELEETGIVNTIEDRQRFDAAAGMQFDATTLSSVGLRYNYSRFEYEEDLRVDRDIHSVSAFYRRNFNDGRDSLELRPSYSFRDSDEADANSYLLQIGWKHRSTELGTLEVLAGGRYTEEKKPGQDQFDNSGFAAEIYYDKEWQVSALHLGFERDLRYDANDQLREVDHFSVVYEHKLTERLEFSLLGNLYFTRLELENGDDNSQYFNILPRLAYKFTERHFVRLAL